MAEEWWRCSTCVHKGEGAYDRDGRMSPCAMCQMTEDSPGNWEPFLYMVIDDERRV